MAALIRQAISSVRQRLMLAFALVTAFAVMVALAAGFSFDEVDRVLKRITEQQVREVYWRSLSREPTDSELLDCVTFVRQQHEYHGSAERALTDLCHVMFNLNEFVYVD